MTDNRWGLSIVVFTASTGFFSAWHFLAIFLH